jgi:hypothetical protein
VNPELFYGVTPFYGNGIECSRKPLTISSGLADLRNERALCMRIGWLGWDCETSRSLVKTDKLSIELAHVRGIERRYITYHINPMLPFGRITIMIF